MSCTSKEIRGLQASSTSAADQRKSNSSTTSSGKISTYVPSSRNSSVRSEEPLDKTQTVDKTGSNETGSPSVEGHDTTKQEDGETNDKGQSNIKENDEVNADRKEHQNRENAARIIQNLPMMPPDLTDFAAYLTNKVELQCIPDSPVVKRKVTL